MYTKYMNFRIYQISRNVLITTFTLCLSTSFAQQTDDAAIWSDSVVQTEDEGPAILIIPMQGQMHTDIHHDVLVPLKDRIKESKPDYILIEMLSRDWRNGFHQLMGWGDRFEFSGYVKDDIMEIAKLFHVELKEFNQVMWVQDASGASSILALSWPTLYMSQDGYLHATMGLSRQFDYIKADDTHGKIREAVLAHLKALALYGNRYQELLRAFGDPEVPLSGTWKGKEVVWEESLNGDFIIDRGEGMPHLSASTAAEVGISKGNVRTRNDVLLAMGIREYHLVGEDITEEINNSTTIWRDNFEKACDAWLDAEQYARWATGEDTARYMRKQISELQRLLKMMKKSSPVEMRISWKYKIRIASLEKMIEQLKEQLDNIREGGNGGGGGGRGPGGGGRG